jgi:hypothetical protein
MRNSNTIFKAAILVILTIAVISAPLRATHVKSYGFKGGTDGAYPDAPLVEDINGNFYGTTTFGGQASRYCNQNGCGTVFELSRNQNGAWIKTTIYNFTGLTDGQYPQGLTLDASGNIYGSLKAAARSTALYSN